MANMRSIRCVLMGFFARRDRLSTVVDGFHRSHRYQVVGDCRGLPAAWRGRCGDLSRAVLRVIGNFAACRREPRCSGRTELVGAD